MSSDICCHGSVGPSTEKPTMGAGCGLMHTALGRSGSPVSWRAPFDEASPFPSFCARRTPGLKSLSCVAQGRPQQALPSFPAVTWWRETLGPLQGPFWFQDSASSISNKMHGEKEEKIT